MMKKSLLIAGLTLTGLATLGCPERKNQNNPSDDPTNSYERPLERDNTTGNNVQDQRNNWNKHPDETGHNNENGMQNQQEQNSLKDKNTSDNKGPGSINQ